MQFYWTPPPGPRAGDPALGVPARLRRFLTLSTAAHVAGAVLATWLSLSLVPPRPDEALLVRTIDFVEPAPARPPAGGGHPRERAGGGPVVRTPRPAARAAPAPRPSPPPAASTPAPPAPPAPARDTEAGDMPTPTPTPEEARLAAATPKAIAGAARGPAPVVAPPRQQMPEPSAAPAAVAGTDGGEGPRATVALPPSLVHGRGAGGAGTGSGGATGAGTGVGTGPGTSGGAGGAGGAGIDPGDPDFSEYFRLIERRVRAAWRFPESLGGTTQTVKIGFALAPEGSLRDARVVSSSSATLNESALSAMKRAAPFPPLPPKFRALAGQPLVMSFTIIIR